jgi:hypothetical protein
MFLAVLICVANVSAQDIGVTLFRAVTMNLDGSGITIAQPEASLDANYQLWQVTPGNTGHAASLFTYASSNGTANVFPNSLGADSWHADGVGQLLYGIPGGIAQNVTRVDSFEANYFIYTYVLNSLPATIADPIVNQSFSFGQLTVSSQQVVDSDYDNAAVQSRTFFVSSVNNYGTGGGNTTNATSPGTAYNSIGVGAYSGGTFANSLGPTLDNGRHHRAGGGNQRRGAAGRRRGHGADASGIARRWRCGYEFRLRHAHDQSLAAQWRGENAGLDEFHRFAARYALRRRCVEFI